MPHFLNISLATVAIHTLLLTQPSFTTSQQVLNGDTQCASLSELGTRNLQRYSASASITVSPQKNCDYSLAFQFKHDPSLPIATANDCVPNVMAPDGVPFLGSRWHYKRLPTYVKKATGVDHISLDFNPCGHPPADVFTVPHYDAHMYMVSPKARTCMTCDIIPGKPVCNPEEQTTENGRALFHAATVQPSGKIANMPDGFKSHPYNVVPLMGSHYWNGATQPDLNIEPWEDPVWIMGSLDGAISLIEPMFPLTFVTGKVDREYNEELTYVSQTDKRLPFRYTVSYNATTEFATITIVGKSALCGKEFRKAKRDHDNSKNPTKGDHS